LLEAARVGDFSYWWILHFMKALAAPADGICRLPMAFAPAGGILVFREVGAAGHKDHRIPICCNLLISCETSGPYGKHQSIENHS